MSDDERREQWLLMLIRRRPRLSADAAATLLKLLPARDGKSDKA